jgi:hypothetical protein
MGVLEDAIREHLDLKRRHGASDEELNEQEAEALGPARRDLPEGEVEPAEEVPVAPEHVEPEPVPVEEHPAVEPAAPVSHEETEPSEAPPPAGAGGDTVIYAPGEAPVPPDEDEDEDPDFGAEAPEQSSPRDLDFE